MTAMLGAVLSLCSPANTQTKWQPNEFPIGYWLGPPPEANTLETWRTVKECNFTFCGPRGGYSVEQNLRMLDFCEQVGIRALVVDSRINWQMVYADDWPDTIRKIVADYGSHPALYGYYIKDEPNYELFEPLGLICREFQERDPQHLAYINLFPTYASVRQLGTPTYADHLDRFLSTVKPQVLSYDHYCLLKNGQDRPDYFENLALIREYGLRYDTPPWNIILSLPHFGYRDPTAGEMRWQVSTSLAYGIKGIMYFTYWTSKSWEEKGDIAIVDSEGKPARLYPIVQQLNAEIQALGKTLLRLTSTGVFHTGDIPPACRRLGTDTVASPTDDLPLVLGFFEDESRIEYVMVVNRDYRTPAEFDMRTKPHVTAVAEISAQNGAEAPVELTEGKFHVQLEPGGGKLFKLTTEFRYAKPPEPATEINFRFDRAGDLEGWGEFHSLSSPTVQSDILTLTFTGADPHFSRRLLRIAPDTYSCLKVRMKLPNCEPKGQLFWTTADSPRFGDDKYMDFPTIPDGQWHEYTIPVSDHDMWQGRAIRAIRLDPTTGAAAPGSQVQIDWIVGE